MEKEKIILQSYNTDYTEGIGPWAPWYGEADRDLRMVLGDQWKAADLETLREEKRNAYVFNNTRRIIKMVAGYQRKNRLSSVSEPVEGSDESTAEILTDLLLWQMQSGEGYNTLSDAFEYGPLITGINMVSLWMDYREDLESGDIRISREPYNAFMVDPNFTRMDLADAGYYIRRRFVSPDEAKLLLPGQSKDIDKLPTGITDDKFSYMMYNQKHPGEMLTYTEYWRKITKRRDMLIDNFSGQTKLWNGDSSGLKLFKEQYPWVESKSIYVPAVELNVIVQDEVMRTEVNPYGLDEYPFVPVIGFYAPECSSFVYRMQGLARCMRDPQEALNKERSRMSDVVGSQPNSGWIVREGAVKNKKDLFKTGQGVVIERSMDSRPEDVEKIRPGEVAQTSPLMVQELEKNIMEIPGANEELLGVADAGNSEMSGVLAKVRSANGLTTLQDLFDNLAFSQKLLGKKLIKLMQRNFTPEKVQRITGKEPTPEFYSGDFGKYDCVVKEGMLTDTQRNMAYVQALQARQVGIAIPDSFIIENMPIANKDELKEAYEREAQAAQVQQQKVEEDELLKRKLMNAETIHKLSLAEQQRQRGVADLALARERLSESTQNKANAVLDLVKAAVEIKGINQSQLIEAISFLENLKETSADEDRRDILETSVALTNEMKAQNEEVGKSKREKEQEKANELQQLMNNLSLASQSSVTTQP